MSASSSVGAVIDGVCEQPVVFTCEGEQLTGMLHQGRSDNHCAVVIVVGGPQYRVGSHRQFLLLARYLASNGITVMRFDYRGMGDSGGELLGFEHIEPDILAALNALRNRAPQVRRVVGFGLCDAASALLIHTQAASAFDGFVLLNPWVTEGEVASAVMAKHYYLARLRNPFFWRRMMRGDIRLGRSVVALLARIIRMFRSSPRAPSNDSKLSLCERMALGMVNTSAPALLITSGRDLTAAEFLRCANTNSHWRALMASKRVRHQHIEAANHTFSSAAWRSQVEHSVLQWLCDTQLWPHEVNGLDQDL